MNILLKNYCTQSPKLKSRYTSALFYFVHAANMMTLAAFEYYVEVI